MMGKTVLTPSAAPSSFSFTTMRVLVLIAVHMALLAATSGTHLESKRVWLFKCCDLDQMLSADGEACVEANWGGNFSIKTKNFLEVVPPLDSEWVRRWLPPGLPMESIREVFVQSGYFLSVTAVSPVNASSLWDPALFEKEDLLKNTVAFLDKHFIARAKPGGGYRKASYCVDAALPPLGPYAMLSKAECGREECVYECCWNRGIMKNDDRHWKCEDKDEGIWAPHKSSFFATDPEFPYSSYYNFCENPRLLPFDERYTEWSRHTGGIHQFHFSSWDTCFSFYDSSNGSLHEGLFYCEHSRITRGVYWLLRPLCFVSALLLTVSLMSVACDNSMRRNTHGQCLASHAASLLAFNIGQTVYYLSISNRLDEEGKEVIPADLHTVCKYFALTMYFMLTSAWIWLMALCVNMARGFRLHMPRRNEGSGKRFLAISAFAWGLPAVLTITCSVLFTQPDKWKAPAWYTPSLIETRMCYIEPLSRFEVTSEDIPFMKSGTALFYYGPVFCLVLSNIVCLVVTLRKVQYLKRGNSVLRREEDQIPLGQRGTEGNSPTTAHNATGNAQTQRGKNRRGTAVDAKTIKLYIKMVLLSGGIELLTEIIMWFTTYENTTLNFIPENVRINSRKDRDLAYRAAGYVTDFFRAAVVTWLAAPEGGYLALIMGMLRRDKKGKKAPGAGNAGRRKLNVA